MKLPYQFCFLGLLIIIFCTNTASSQAYEPPKPLMNNKIFADFLKTHAYYPEASIQSGTEGTVRISFTLDTQGKVLSRAVSESVSPEIDHDALRVFDMIMWEPAKEYGLSIEKGSSFELTYKIKKYKRLVKNRGYDKLPKHSDIADPSGTVYSLKKVDKKPFPILPEGYDQLVNYVYATIKYPQAAQKLNISGTVQLDFIIESTGLSSNIIIREAVGGGCTEEAISLIQQLKWLPAQIGDTAVRVSSTMSIQFQPGINDKLKYMPAQTKTGL